MINLHVKHLCKIHKKRVATITSGEEKCVCGLKSRDKFSVCSGPLNNTEVRGADARVVKNLLTTFDSPKP